MTFEVYHSPYRIPIHNCCRGANQTSKLQEKKNARHRLVSTFLAALLSYEISQCRLICSWCSYRSVHSKSLLIRLISHSLIERKNTQKWAKIASPLTNVMCWRFFWPQTSIWDIMKKIRFEVRMIVLPFLSFSFVWAKNEESWVSWDTFPNIYKSNQWELKVWSGVHAN